MIQNCIFCSSPINFDGTSKFSKKLCISELCYEREVYYYQETNLDHYFMFYINSGDNLFTITYLYFNEDPKNYLVKIKKFSHSKNESMSTRNVYSSTHSVDQVLFTPQNFEQKIPFLLNYS